MSAWPPPDPAQLAAAVEDVADRLTEPELRAQLFGLAAVLRNLGRETTDAAQRAAIVSELEAAVAAGDEPAVVRALRRLAALDRDAVIPADWSKVSRG